MFAGLLLAWELVGIRLTEEPLTNFKLMLKSPEAAPFVLIALVTYFSFRITVEWLQCDLGRRALKVAKIDFAMAHTLAVVSIGLYGLQRTADFQVAEAIAGTYLGQFAAGFLAAVVATMLWQVLQGSRYLTRLPRVASRLLLAVLVIVICGGGYVILTRDPGAFLMTLGWVFIGFLIFLLLKRFLTTSA